MGRERTSAPATSSANRVFGVRIDPELAKKLKILAVKKDTQAYKLLEEAITDLLKKHKEL